MKPLDYYAILNVSPDSTLKEIKARYHELALEYHPDKCKNNDHQAFQEIQQAYEILSNPKEKYAYDDNVKVVTDTIYLSDMLLVNEYYEYPCRCGDKFTVAFQETVVSSEEEQVEYELECTGCSLSIILCV